ncbi:MAG TPA: hypothetical protein VGJ64_00585 [Gemmatimonadaceae bacterium]|jgi:hypothetical protein
MPRFEAVIGQQPRFALATPHFRFRALATFAGRASLGGDREVAMACLVAGRLASGMLAPFDFPVSGAKARSAAAKQWLSALSLPPAIRTPLTQVADAAASGNPASAAAALERMLVTVSGNIDEASASELRALAAELATTQPAN